MPDSVPIKATILMTPAQTGSNCWVVGYSISEGSQQEALLPVRAVDADLQRGDKVLIRIERDEM
jgi:hypothetical protein